MADSVSDGQTRQVLNRAENIVYKVTIPTGWVSNHQNQLSQLSSEYVWGDLYEGSPHGMQELPDGIKRQFGLNGPVRVQGRARDNEVQDVEERRVRGRGGKSKKQSARRRRRSSKARKSRKSRTTRRR